MSDDATEARFHAILRDIELDLRYAAFCTARIARPNRPTGRFDAATIRQCVDGLPLPFDHRRSEDFFRHRAELDDGATLLFHLAVRGRLVEPMIYLKVGAAVHGAPLAMLTLDLLRTRPGTEVPEPRRLALLVNDAEDLSTALGFVTELFLLVRTSVRSAGPWLPTSPTAGDVSV